MWENGWKFLLKRGRGRESGGGECSKICVHVENMNIYSIPVWYVWNLMSCHFRDLVISWRDGGGKKSDECENGNGISRKRGGRKRKLHSEREWHGTAGSWVGGGNRGEVPRQAWVSAWVEICESPSSSSHCNPETRTKRSSASMRVHERQGEREDCNNDSTTRQHFFF